MMHRISWRVLAVVLILFGMLSVFTGSFVLLGFREPHYSPYWLIIFYTLMGVVELLVAFKIWQLKSNLGRASLFILVAHLLVTLALVFIVKDSAIQNIIGMGVRAGLWGIAVLVLKFS